MDYRNLSLDRLTWVAGKAWYGGAGKLVFQTPPAACKINPLPKFGPHAHSLGLTFGSEKFQTFIQSVQHTAELQERTVRGLEVAPSMSWSGSMWLSSFGDTKWFDEGGHHVETPVSGMNRCACVLQLTGVWLSHANGTWGLKWRVLECKALSPSPTSLETWSFREDVQPAQQQQEWAFRDDLDVGRHQREDTRAGASDGEQSQRAEFIDSNTGGGSRDASLQLGDAIVQHDEHNDSHK